MKTALAQWPMSASPPVPQSVAIVTAEAAVPARASSSSTGLSISLSPVASPGSLVPEAPQESFLTCLEKFFLCEHKNSLNIVLFGATFALFVSDGFSRKVPLIPPTSRVNVVYKTLVSAGLLAQLIFELKNVDRSVWVHSRAVGSSAAGRGGAGGRPANGGMMYKLPSAFSLSPAPINFSSPLHNNANLSANGGVALAPLVPVLPVASTSNLTAVDRQLESVGLSLLMLAFNSLMLKVFFQRPLGAPGEHVSRWECNTVTKVYTVANALGMLGALKGLAVAIYRERARRRSFERMAQSNNIDLPSALDAPSSAASAATADPQRSLPLLLPSFSFIQLIHALFIYPQSRTRVGEILDASVSAAVPAGSAAAVISKAASDIGSSAASAASSTDSSSLMSSVPILRVMACLSLFYWNAHYKSVDCNGSGGNGSTSQRGPALEPPSFLRGNTQLAYNCKLVACLLLFTQMMARGS